MRRHLFLLTVPASAPGPYIGGLNTILNLQQEYDSITGAEFPARLDSPSTEQSLIGELVLGEFLGATRYSTLFGVANIPEMIVKYQIESDDDYMNDISERINGADVLHPLFREYHFLQIANRFGLSPKVWFVSGPSVVKTDCGFKCRFKDMAMTPETFASHYQVRFLVIEKLHISLQEMINQRLEYEDLSFSAAIGLGISMLEIVQRLHEQAGIIHADIHAGNFMLAEDGRLKLIDFGKAYSVTDVDILISMGEEKPFVSGNHNMFSPWEMKGFIQAKRDDVFRAVLTLARLVNGVELTEFLDNNNAAWNICSHLKSSGRMFSYPLATAPRTDSSPTDIHITKSLDRIAALAARPRHIQLRPFYEEIIGELNIILSLTGDV